MDGPPRGLGIMWGGPGCRIGNVAYGKIVSQTGTWMYYDAYYAIDGRIDPVLEDGYCAHMEADLGKPSAWMVDLNGLHVIHNVTLYNRRSLIYYQRMTDMKVYLSNSSDITAIDGELCGRFEGTVPDGGKVTILCESSKQARYVIVQNGENVLGREYLTLCEVVVMGYKAIDCSSCAESSTCDALYGCQECPEGKRKPDCTQDVVTEEPDDGQDGGTEKRCNCISGSCDTSGSCQNGCRDWWILHDCTKLIEVPSLIRVQPKITAASEKSMEIQFKQLDISSDLAQYYHYQLEYKTDNSSFTLDSERLSYHVDGLELGSVTSSKLKAGVQYQLRIMPYREIEVLTFGDKKRQPGVPSQEIEFFIAQSNKCVDAGKDGENNGKIGEGSEGSGECCNTPLLAGIGVAVVVGFAILCAVITGVVCNSRMKKDDPGEEVYSTMNL